MKYINVIALMSFAQLTYGVTSIDSENCKLNNNLGTSLSFDLSSLYKSSKPVLSILDPGKKRIDKYAAQDKDYKVKKVLYTSSEEGPTSIKYDFGYERLKPGECIYLVIPERLRDKPVLFVNLGHTQSASDNTGYNSKTKWDENPALTTVQLNQSNENGKSQWRYWNGLSSGEYGAKFAEPTHMEMEGLYEWYKYGHKDVKTNTLSKDALYVDGARVCSMGKDPVTLGSLTVKMAPSSSKEYKEINISKSNIMGDPLTAKNRNYGDRSDAIFLGGFNSKKISEDLELKNGRLEMKLKKGVSLNSLEVSIGDKRDNGDSGSARLVSYILKNDGARVSITKRENVPPEGVLVGSPEDPDYKIQNGDRLVIESVWDQSFVMGLRVGYN